MFGAMYFFKKQREEDKRMKKKVLAFLLASTMVIEPFTVASAADFSDGMGQDTVQFSDDAEDVPEVENDDVDQFGTDTVGEGEESTETHVKIGDKVWVDFDNVNGIATISGSGSTWDYYQDGTAVPDYKFKNPFVDKTFNKVIIKRGITRLGDYLFHASRNFGYEDPGDARNTQIYELEISDTVTEIGKYSFYEVEKLKSLQFPSSLKRIDESAFGSIKSLVNIQLNEGLKTIGKYAFRLTGISNVRLPQSVTEIGEYAFSTCLSLKDVEGFEKLTIIPDGIFQSCPIEKFDFSNTVQIGKSSFKNTKIKNLDFLTEKLTKIDDFAFSQCEQLKNVNIPNSVKEIGKYAFEKTALEKIVIPDSVITLGWGTFSECKNLVDISLPNNALSLGGTFVKCVNIKSLVIPENIIELKDTFTGCIRLQNVTIKGQKTKIPYSGMDDDEHAFTGCNGLQYISGYDCSYAKKIAEQNNIPFDSLGKSDHQWSTEKEVIKEPTCTEEGENVYRCEICGATKKAENSLAYGHKWNEGVITKPATETEEGEIQYTCWRCNKTKTEPIPKLPSIQIEDASYGWLAVNTLHIKGITNKDASYYVTYVPRGDDKPEYDQQHEREDTSDNYISAQITVPNYEIDVYIFAVDKNGNVTYAKITPDYTQRPQKPVYQVGDNVTASVDGDTVTITGKGETYDKSWWFEDNVNQNNIKYIIVEDGVTSLGSSIFYGFSQVKDVKLPTSLKSIGYGAFEKCDSLKELTIPEGVTNIGNGIINSCTSIKKISLPSTLNTIPRLIDMESTGDMQLDEIVLNDGIKTLGNYAFWNFRNLKNIIIPESVTNIGESAFHGCTALSNLTLPDSITEIAGEAFSNCVSLGKVTLPKNLTLLGNGVFENCNAEIIFPASLKCIPIMGDNAVTKVTIPEGVKMIGEEAFAYCSNFTEITLPSTITNIERSAFFNTPITEFIYPQNIDNIPASVFYGTKLKEFSVPDNVTEIDDGAFYDCTDLVKISIPESVTYIGNDVFKNCRNLVIYGKRDSVAERYAYINNIKFVSGQYKVVFKDNGRTVDTYYIDKGENATPPSLKEKPGYTLSWDADYTNIQEDMVINAVWTKKDNGGGNTTIIVSPSETNKYTVTFKDRGKIVKTEKVKSGDAAEYPYINRNGYELSWDKDFSKVTANITVNAVWTVIKPNKVTSLTAEVQKNSIDLSWDRAENTDYYLVYRKATSDTEYKQIKKTTKILWTDEDVEPGTEYSYKVVGVCSVDGKKYQGADSDIVTAKIGTPQIGDVYSVGDLKYKVTGAKEVSVIGLAKEEVEIKIPSAVSISGKAYKVTSVQAKAFYQNEDIVSIAIGNNVTYVGKYAFYQCPNLEAVKFGKRVSVISTCAFTQCPNLENVTLPSSIRRIGAKAFYQCTSIKVLKINGSVLEYVGKKGLAVNKTVTLRLPKKVYTKYKKLIKVSGVYSKTKFVKF